MFVRIFFRQQNYAGQESEGDWRTQLKRWLIKTDENNREQSVVTSGDDGAKKFFAARKVVLTRKSPIPPPEDFAKYKEVMPDLPERIFKQFEEDSVTIRELTKEAQAADVELQKKAQAADIEFEKRSHWMAFSVILVGLFGTFILAYLDKDVAAVTTGIGTILLIFKGVFSKDNSKIKNSEDSDDWKAFVVWGFFCANLPVNFNLGIIQILMIKTEKSRNLRGKNITR